MKSPIRILFVACTALHCFAAHSLAANGETEIAKWRDDKKSAFLLMFDDSLPSAWQMALPALVERDMIATFYVNAGKAEFTKFQGKWSKDMLDAGMILGDHTMTHQGVKDFDNADEEIGGCATAIRAITVGKAPRLMSFGMPGVGPGKWNISADQMKELLAKYHLIDRPTFVGHGAVYHWQTAKQMLALADKGIASGEMEYLIIHGVERRGINWGYQDFWALNYDIFLAVLDGLKERRDHGDIWMTDHISWYRYQAERKSSTVKVVQADSNAITVELTCSLDHDDYDLPLTLKTTVPASWSKASVTQGTKPLKTVAAKKSLILFDAVPGDGPIKISNQP